MPDHSVAKKVSEALAEVAPQVESQVVEAFVKREVNKRAEALVKVIDKLTETERDAKKLGPDNVQYDEVGTAIGKYYSKKRTDERKASDQKIAKLTRAINKALLDNDFGEVYNLATGKDTPENKPADSE